MFLTRVWIGVITLKVFGILATVVLATTEVLKTVD